MIFVVPGFLSRRGSAFLSPAAATAHGDGDETITRAGDPGAIVHQPSTSPQFNAA
jgi:hypothetical protein